MRTVRVVLLAALCLVSPVVVRSADYTEEENVLVLTKDNFDDALKEFPDILVEFYAPWCGHCKSLAPEYAKAAGSLRDNSETKNLRLAKVDATVEADLASKYGVRGYPTLKFFHDGQESEYNGPRQAEGIVNWLKKKTGFPANKLADVDAAKKFISDREVAVVGFFKDENSDEAKAFLDTVRAFDDIEFGYVSDDVVAKEYKTAGKNKMVLFKNFDDRQVDYSGDFDKTKLVSWVKENSLPLFIEFNQQTAQRVFAGDIKSHLLVFMSKAAENFQKVNESVRDLATKYKNKMLMVFVNTDTEENSRITEFFGLTKDALPAVRLISLADQLVKYKPEAGDLNPETLTKFIDSYLGGKLKPHLNSQDVPEDWNSKSVKVLVGKNFDEVAFDKSKDVLVEFYAPWCGHCKKLAPIYDELGDHFKDSDSVVIAKMDATANELEHTRIDSFPTIKLFKKGDNSVVEYGGERTLEGMIKFVESGGEYGKGTDEDDADADEDEEVPEKKDDKKDDKKKDDKKNKDKEEL